MNIDEHNEATTRFETLGWRHTHLRARMQLAAGALGCPSWAQVAELLMREKIEMTEIEHERAELEEKLAIPPEQDPEEPVIEILFDPDEARFHPDGRAIEVSYVELGDRSRFTEAGREELAQDDSLEAFAAKVRGWNGKSLSIVDSMQAAQHYHNLLEAQRRLLAAKPTNFNRMPWWRAILKALFP